MVTLQEYLATIKLKMGDNKGGQLFHALCRGNDATRVNFLYYPQHNTEVAHVINELPYIIAYESGINPVGIITRECTESSSFGTWYPVHRILTDPNDLHNE